MNRLLTDENATLAEGARLAPLLADGGLVYLEGDLGAGKTTLVRALLRAMGWSGPVKSPTYTVVEPYCIENKDIYHFDLYRLSDPEELEFLGFRDYLEGDGLVLVEWPSRGAGWLPAPDLRLQLTTPSKKISIEDDKMPNAVNNDRIVSYLAETPRGKLMLKGLR